MRKRVVLTAIVAVVIGVAAYVISQPRKGTIEWHKAKFMKCFNRMWNDTLWGRTERLAKRLVGFPPPPTPHPGAATEARSHLSALVALGYLAERRYVITNRSLNDVLGQTYQRRRVLGRKHHPLHLTERVEGADQLAIVALPEVALQYDDLIRQADVPKTK